MAKTGVGRKGEPKAVVKRLCAAIGIEGCCARHEGLRGLSGMCCCTSSRQGLVEGGREEDV